jgi:hypothetical protein
MKFIMTRWIVACAAVALLSVATVSLALAGDILRLEARLSGPRIGNLQPSGHGDWRLLDNNRDRRISVEVEDVNLPAGTRLRVRACGSAIGVITLSGPPVRGGDLNLDTRDGDSVPTCRRGDRVVVNRGDTTILSGRFQPD